jgi:hypothetical protein
LITSRGSRHEADHPERANRDFDKFEFSKERSPFDLDDLPGVSCSTFAMLKSARSGRESIFS